VVILLTVTDHVPRHVDVASEQSRQAWQAGSAQQAVGGQAEPGHVPAGDVDHLGERRVSPTNSAGLVLRSDRIAAGSRRPSPLGHNSGFILAAVLGAVGPTGPVNDQSEPDGSRKQDDHDQVHRTGDRPSP
jgi:hypothetical protein